MTTNTELIARLRSFETDHKPDGWPAIQMRDVSALLDAIEALEAENSETKRLRDEWKKSAEELLIERDTLKSQLAAAQGQKPVAWIDAFDNISHADSETDESKIGRDPLYAAPIPQQPAPSVALWKTEP